MRAILRSGGIVPSGAGGGFGPIASLGAALTAWWSAEGTGDGEITGWTSSVGGFTATGVAGSVPVSAPTSFYGRRGLTFDGVNDALTLAPITGAIPVGTTPGEMWVSGINSELPGVGNRSPVAYGDAAAATNRQFRRNSSLNPLLTEASAGNNLSDFHFGPLWQGMPLVFGGAWDTTAQYGRANGRKFPYSFLVTVNTATARLRIGARMNAAADLFWAGVIRHVMVTTWLTETQRQQLEAWLAWDAGIQSLLPFNHPYRSVRP